MKANRESKFRGLKMISCLMISLSATASGQISWDSVVSDVPEVISNELCEGPLMVNSEPLTEQARVALAQCELATDEHDRAACTVLRGLELWSEGDPEAAGSNFRHAADLYRSLKDRWGAWLSHSLIADSALATGHSQIAQSNLDMGLKMLSSLPSLTNTIPRRSLALFVEIGGGDGDLLRYTDALPELMTSAFVEIASVETHHALGLVLGCQRRFEKAERHLRQALERARARADLFDTSEYHGHLGWLYQRHGRHGDAKRSYRQALEEAQAQGNAPIALASAERLQHLYSLNEELEEALNINQEAITLASFDASRQARLWADRAVLLARAGRMPEARRTLDTARSVAQISGQHLVEEELLVSTGSRLLVLEYFEDAAESLQEAVTLLRREPITKAGHELLERAHFFLAATYLRLGDDSMVDFEMPKLEELAVDSGNLFSLLLDQMSSAGKPEAYTEATRRLIQAARNSDNTYWKAFGLQIERIHRIFAPIFEMEDPVKIQEYLVEQAKSQVDDPFLGLFMNSLLPIFENLHDDRKFHQAAEELLQSLHGMIHPTPLQEAQALHMSAVSDGLMGNRPAEAAVNMSEAIRIFESVIGGMGVDETIMGVMDDLGSHLYRGAVEILARVDEEESFLYAERGRAWTLRRLLGSRRTYSPDSQRQLLAQISKLEREMREASGSAATQAMQEELEALRHEYMATRLRFKIATREDSSPDLLEPIDLDQLQQDVLPDGSALLAYFPGSSELDYPRLWIWVVGSDELITAHTPMTREDWKVLECNIQVLRLEGISRGAEEVRKVRGARLLPGCDSQTASVDALYQQLIKPVEISLRKYDRLIAVPYGVLHHLPFAALRNPETGRYLLEDFIVSTAPSASALKLLSRRSKSAAGEALVLGDPRSFLERLIGARDEANAVAGMMETEALIEDRATESSIYERAGQIRLLHLAAHGEYVPGNPYFSRVLLSADHLNDGVLSMHEVLDRLDLSGAQLVVLSGCETALGQVTEGDEIIGLQRAFLIAGARSVISTLWPVDDRASSQLMTAFYRRYLEEGATAVEALRSAQLELLQQEETASPYYWAGFVFTGDPDNRWRRPGASLTDL